MACKSTATIVTGEEEGDAAECGWDTADAIELLDDAATVLIDELAAADESLLSFPTSSLACVCACCWFVTSC